MQITLGDDPYIYIHVANHHGHIYRDQKHTSLIEVESQNPLECVWSSNINVVLERTHMQYNEHAMTLCGIQLENHGVEEANHT